MDRISSLQLIRILAHVISLICAVLAVIVFVFFMIKADNIVKQTDAAALSLCIAILPYCFARAVDALSREHWQ